MSKHYKKKETALFNIGEGENFNNKKFDLFRNDRDCVLAALNTGVSYDHYPQEWLGDKEMSHAYLAFKKKNSSEGLVASTVGIALLDDKEFILNVLQEVICVNQVDIYIVLSNRLRADTEIASLVLRSEPALLLMMDEELRSSSSVMHAFVDGLFNQSQFGKFNSATLYITLKQLRFPLLKWERTGDVDEMHAFIDRREFSQTLDAQLSARSVDHQTIKI